MSPSCHKSITGTHCENSLYFIKGFGVREGPAKLERFDRSTQSNHMETQKDKHSDENSETFHFELRLFLLLDPQTQKKKKSVFKYL